MHPYGVLLTSSYAKADLLPPFGKWGLFAPSAKRSTGVSADSPEATPGHVGVVLDGGSSRRRMRGKCAVKRLSMPLQMARRCVSSSAEMAFLVWRPRRASENKPAGAVRPVAHASPPFLRGGQEGHTGRTKTNQKAKAPVDPAP